MVKDDESFHMSNGTEGMQGMQPGMQGAQGTQPGARTGVQAVQPIASSQGRARVGAPAAASVAATGQAPVAGEAEEEDDNRYEVPETEMLRNELTRVTNRTKFRSAVRNTILAIVSVAAISVLISMLFMPVLRIYGSSMTPTLYEGDTVVCIKTDSLTTGDVVAFYYNNKVLVKRVIAGPGSWVDISDNGVVKVNDRVIDEPYVSELALGDTDIRYPYQVPDNRYFVMGDHRATSVDSRLSAVGCISTDQLVGKVIAVIWPLDKFGLVG